ncbi:MAG: cysteine desulfurase family protein [Armatimonadota bacterium]
MLPFEPPVYLDYAASTPPDSRVLEEMLPWLSSEFGNASSTHSFGRRARAALDLARDRVAALLHAKPAEICFTSGGTEADNLAVIGAALAAPPERRRVVISAVEHHAVLHAAASLTRFGFEVCHIPVNSSGHLLIEQAARLIDRNTALVSVMLVNNETGVVMPVAKVARLARKAGALMHTDAVQAAGLLRLDPADLGVDLLSISAHKIYGPKGAGVLWVRKGVQLVPVIHGGAQERERRGGTENVAAIAGFGRAAQIALEERQQIVEAVEAARDAFLEGFASLRDYPLHCEAARRVASILNIHFPGLESELFLMRLDTMGIAASSGSACASGSQEPSHVLKAMGCPEPEVKCSVRFSFGRTLDPETARRAGTAVREVAREMLSRLRDLSPACLIPPASSSA